MTDNLQNYVVGKVKDRLLIRIKPGEYHILRRILNREYPYKLMPIVYAVTENGCWQCLTGSIARRPYPTVLFNGKMHKVSRLIFEEFYGPLIEGEMILHTCDNPGCINPYHLYAGTAKDNARDFMERGRSKYPSTVRPAYPKRHKKTVCSASVDEK